MIGLDLAELLTAKPIVSIDMISMIIPCAGYQLISVRAKAEVTRLIG